MIKEKASKVENRKRSNDAINRITKYIESNIIQYSFHFILQFFFFYYYSMRSRSILKQDNTEEVNKKKRKKKKMKSKRISLHVKMEDINRRQAKNTSIFIS